MNRRELLSRLVAGTGIAGEVEAVEESPKPILIQVVTEQHLSREQRRCILDTWEELRGTVEDLPPLVILGPGARLEAICGPEDARSRVDRYTRLLESGKLTMNDIRELEDLTRPPAHL